jgi:general secretion pathway protein D
MARCAFFALLTVSLVLFVASCKSAPKKVVPLAAPKVAPTALTEKPETGPKAPEQPATSPELEQIKKELNLKEQETQNMAEHFYKVGKVHFEGNEYAEAEKNLKLAVQLNPNYEEARELLYRTQMMLDKRYPEYKTTKEDLAQRRRVLIDQEIKQLERDYNAAVRLFEKGEFDRAKSMFEDCLGRIRWFSHPIDTKKDYEQLCKSMILDCDKRTRDQKVKERIEKEAVAQEMAQREEANNLEQKRRKIEILIQRITDAIHIGQYERAETLCRELLEQDPGNFEGKKLLSFAVEGRHAYTQMQTLKDMQEYKKRESEELDETKVPYHDPVRFPDKEKWLGVIIKRSPGIAPESEEEPAEIQHINKILETRPVTLQFQDTPLTQVVSFLQDITGLNITIDPQIEANAPVTLRLRDIILKNALQLIMDQTGYMYIFKENVIFITTKSPVTGEGIFEIYNVSDILAKIPHFIGPEIKIIDPETEGRTGAGGGRPISFTEPGEEEEGEVFGPEELIELIEAATGKENWPGGEAGGFGTIDQHRGQLIVINSREIHKKVREVLDNLRRNTGIFVVMEVRFIDVMSDFLEEIGIDYRGLGLGGATIGDPFSMITNNSGGTDAGITKRVPTPDRRNLAGRLQNSFDGFPGLFGGRRLQPQVGSGLWLQSTWIEPFQLQAILHARDEKVKVQNVTCAMITAHNRQRVFMSVLNQRAYIADYDTSGQGGLAPFEVGDPIIRNFQEGIVLDVRPVVSSDRKYITIDVRPTYSALTTPQLSTIMVNIGTFGGTVINCPIEVPMTFLERAFTSVTIPDGGTALLGGLKEVTERKYMTSVPILDKIPIINFIFKRKGYVQERRDLIILITGRIVILREEEKIRFGTGPGG